jgi:protein tyrosine phosphatase type 4A
MLMSQNITPLTLIEYKTKRFYISRAPTEDNMKFFIKSLKDNRISHVIRLCEATYDFTQIEHENIIFYHLEIQDGSLPSKNILNEWLKITNNIKEEENILVHCRAGLGRSPLMVAISLINEKMDSYDTIEFIRKHCPGSINMKQLSWLINYKPYKKHRLSFLEYFFNI